MRTGAVMVLICALATLGLATCVDATGQTYLITTCDELQNMSSDLSGSYTLENDIDCSSFGDFIPIGTDSAPFTGTFDGDNYTISGLYIDLPSQNYVGLFGYTNGASITSVGLAGVNITGSYDVGALVGMSNSGIVSDSDSTGYVNGYSNVGGLIGSGVSDVISGDSSAADVNGSVTIGGLIGQSYPDTISNSDSTGSVSGNRDVGGLIGYCNDGTIEGSYFSGYVNGSDSVGGLIGGTYHSVISNSYSTANVDGSANFIGGLIGVSSYNTINSSYSTGNVNGNGYTGGLIGQSYYERVSGSYSTGNVNGGSNAVAGGLVGETYGDTVFNSHSTGTVTTPGHPAGGLIGQSTDSRIFNSYSTGNVIGSFVGYLFGDTLGGLIGSSSSDTISNSYSTGDVTTIGSLVGGLIGESVGSVISNAYSSGNVGGDSYIGGFIGASWTNTISNVYSTGNVNGGYASGGFIGGSNSDTVSSSYWDISRSGQTACGAASGCTGVNSGNSQPSYFYAPANPPLSSWDFSNIWQANPNAYPTLRADVSVVLEGIAITTPATKLAYNVGDQLDISGLVVTGTYSDGSTQVEPITAADVTGFDSTTPNPDETLTVAYDGHTTTYVVDVGVPAPTLEGIAITTPATKLAYNVGDPLDISGLVVTGTYSDGSTQVEPITVADVTGFDSTAPVTGEVLTIAYDGLTATYIVNVVVPAPTWSNSTSSTPPAYSPSLKSYFSIMWTDTSGVNSVLLESNYSGAATNYTMKAVGGNSYNYSAVLPAGAFYWKTYASDAQGRTNMSPAFAFTIAKAAASPALRINSSASSFIQNVSFRANLSCSDTIRANHAIYQNGTILNSSMGTSVTFTQAYTAAGYYNITCAILNNQNYTGQTTLFITARKAAYSTSSFPRLFRYDSQKNANLASALSSISASFRSNGVNMTPELLAATMATLDKEVGGSYLPVEEYGDYGMGPGCTYKVNGRCRSTPYNGGVDYKGRGYIQITGKSNYITYCGPECAGTAAADASDVCGCKNKKYCTVTNVLVCPQVRALQPQYAGQIFASYYVGRNLVSLSQAKSYYTVGLRINGGVAYAKDFQNKANSYVTLFANNRVQTQTLLAWLNS